MESQKMKAINKKPTHSIRILIFYITHIDREITVDASFYRTLLLSSSSPDIFRPEDRMGWNNVFKNNTSEI